MEKERFSHTIGHESRLNRWHQATPMVALGIASGHEQRRKRLRMVL